MANTKVRSLLGPKVIPDLENIGHTFVTDERDEVNVPDDLAQSLLEQTDAWAPAKAPKKGT